MTPSNPRRGLVLALIASLAISFVGQAAAGGDSLVSHGYGISNVVEVGPGPLVSVSCASATNCTAIGVGTSQSFRVLEVNGRWGTPKSFSAPFSESLQSVSCPSVGNCSAVGYVGTDGVGVGVMHQPVVASEVNGIWGPVTKLGVDGVGNLSSVDCSSVGNCVAVGFNPVGLTLSDSAVYSIEENGVWGPVVRIGGVGNGGLDSVSCVTSGNCLAIGGSTEGSKSLPMYSVERDRKWSPLNEVVSSGAIGLAGVSCTASGECVAVGGSLNGGPIELSFVRGRWGPIQRSISPVADSIFSEVSCTQVGNCVAVGTAGSLYDAGIYAIQNGGRWGKVNIVRLPNSGLLLQSVSCPVPDYCSSVGWAFKPKSTLQLGVASVIKSF